MQKITTKADIREKDTPKKKAETDKGKDDEEEEL
jgi:hypothetical protein